MDAKASLHQDIHRDQSPGHVKHWNLRSSGKAGLDELPLVLHPPASMPYILQHMDAKTALHQDILPDQNLVSSTGGTGICLAKQFWMDFHMSSSTCGHAIYT